MNDDEKNKILSDMESRASVDQDSITNYEQWLRIQFDNYFAENFPMIYTKKYWGVNAKELETKWVGNRIYQPTIEEVVEGMKTADTPITYYAKEMRYPKAGGFKSFLKPFLNEENIRYDQSVLKIDPVNKIVTTQNNEYKYDNLYSSIPLTEYASLLNIDNKDVIKAINNLHHTSGYIVSLGMEGDLIKKIYGIISMMKISCQQEFIHQVKNRQTTVLKNTVHCRREYIIKMIMYQTLIKISY